MTAGQSPEKSAPACVGDLISRSLLTCSPETQVAEAAAMMRAAKCSSMVVVAGGRAVGIWTERDAMRLDFSQPGVFDRPLSEVMTPEPRTIPRDAPVSEAGVQFKAARIRHLVVVDEDGQPVGMLSQTDVVLNHGVEHYLTFRDVRSVMTSPVLTLDSTLPLPQAVEAMRTRKVEAAVVLDADGAGPGMVTERDLVRVIAERKVAVTVGQVASRPLITIRPGATLIAARQLFTQHTIRHLAVHDGQDFIGLLSFSDILAILQYEYMEQLNSALKDRDEALIRSRKDLHLARQVIEASVDAVMIVDENSLIEYVNPAFVRVTGYAPEEVEGKKPSVLKSGRHADTFYRDMWQDLLTTGQWQGEVWNRRKDGEVFVAWLSIATIRSDDGRIAKYGAIFNDITERKRHEEKVTRLAYFDALTGLPNRRLLMDRVQMAVSNGHRHGHQVAVMFLDLDLFKRINDTLGHDAGDAVLEETARRLQSCVREGDTVARLGGDEFVILLPELDDAADVGQLAERIIAEVRKPIELKGREMFVTTSVGIGVYPVDSGEIDGLLKAADRAMYEAKQVGRNSFKFASSSIHAHQGAHTSVEQALRRAVENEALSLVYLVKADLVSGTVTGAEALIRWNDPELGMVPPGEFLPLAERMGLMPRLGAWVLRRACAQNRAWRDRGLPPIRMAVNLAASQFHNDDLADIVADALAESGLPASALELELTETAVIDSPLEVGRVLRKVHEQGVRVTIDDFGSRTSSLQVLRSLPVDALKIDRSLLSSAGQPFQDRDLVTAIIKLAHVLGLKVVAEGVETDDQARILREAGCDELQGWLVARPVHAEDIDSLFRRNLLASESVA
ncbi:MAG TPA: EAL domain-containing protein [Magnetospirillum sp.]|jgi:diguanylate cyclase (GGDEF)-like protein/PAS domain S-box-containing protein|nr:EAL domain-containing protein [Magnetospirillum sp.]